MAGVESNCRRRLSGYTTGLLAVTLALYFAGCCLPATSIHSWLFSSTPTDVFLSFGWIHLVFGWMDFPRGFPAWSANVVLWIGIVRVRRGRLREAAVLGILAASLGMTTLTSYKWDGRYAGYYCWQWSLNVFAIGATLGWLLSRRSIRSECGPADEPT